jgi:hypothetical protein
MATEYDATEFVDTDFLTHKSPPATGAILRAPTREEVDVKATETQQKIAELKRAQEALERERGALEELRRRQNEFQTGRAEVIQNLTRGLGLLEKAELAARRDAEQMAKALYGMRSALDQVQTVHEETWTKDNFNVELTRALTTIENARMEWNSAQLKFPVFSGQAQNADGATDAGEPRPSPFANLSFGQLCRLGLAFTWPLALVALLALGVLVTLLLVRH